MFHGRLFGTSTAPFHHDSASSERGSFVALNSCELSSVQLPPHTTVTLYEGQCPEDWLHARLQEVLGANPWLAGALKTNPKDGKLALWVPETPQLAKVFQVKTVEKPASLHRASLDFVVNFKPGLAGTARPICKIVALVEPLHQQWILQMSMSHAVADGHTFYSVYGMLDQNSTVSSMEIERIKYDPLTSLKSPLHWKWLFFAVCRLQWLLCPWPQDKDRVIEVRYVNERWLEGQKAAHDAEPEAPYVTSNDVLVSWFFSLTQPACGFIPINMRERMAGLTGQHAGLYTAALMFYPEEYKRPANIRRAVRRLSSACMPDSSRQSRGAGFCFGAMTAWHTFFRDVDLPGCTQLLHFPVTSVWANYPASQFPLAVIFRPKPGRLAMCSVTSARLPEDPDGPLGDRVQNPLGEADLEDLGRLLRPAKTRWMPSLSSTVFCICCTALLLQRALEWDMLLCWNFQTVAATLQKQVRATFAWSFIMDPVAWVWLLIAWPIGFILWAVMCQVFYRLRGELGKGLVLQKFGQHMFNVVDGDSSSKLIYEEIFHKKAYFKQLVSLENAADSKPLVVDVGGNHGFFSAFVAQHCQDARIHIFEPVPLLVEAICLNLANCGCVAFHAHDGKTVLNDAPQEARIVVHQTALGEEEAELPLTYQPRMLAGSSLFPEVFRPKGVGLIDFTRAMYLDGISVGALPEFPTRSICKLLGIPFLRMLAFTAFLPWMILHQIQQRASGGKLLTLKTPVRKLSDILMEQGLQGKTIDLLKVDVEGAELKVLNGINDETWGCISQLVIEVHDGDDGRVDTIMKLCAAKGFTHITKSQDADLELPKLLKIFLVFARK